MDFKRNKNMIWLENEKGDIIAQIDFPDDPEHIGQVDIRHTEVDPSLAGQGIAGKLVKEAAEQLRKDGRKAKLTCSFAKGWMDRHPEYSDVVSRGE